WVFKSGPLLVRPCIDDLRLWPQSARTNQRDPGLTSDMLMEGFGFWRRRDVQFPLQLLAANLILAKRLRSTAARSVEPHQRPMGLFARRIDLQETLRCPHGVLALLGG